MNEDPVALTIKEAIKSAAKPVQDFISTVVGEPGRELGGWIADHIRGKRLETQIKIFTNAQKLTNEAGIDPKAVNIKLLVPLLENGSLEEDKDVVNMWSHLLANASTSDKVRASYVSMLKELEPVEAKIMQLIYNSTSTQTNKASNEFVIIVNGKPIQDHFRLKHGDFEQAIDNLYRLRLLSPSARRLSFIEGKETPFANYTKESIGLTYLGYYFAKACNSVMKKKDKK